MNTFLGHSYTYANDKRNSYSTIDFWCLSAELKNLASVETIDNMLNFSDHLPLQLDISVRCNLLCNVTNVTECDTCTVHSDPNNRGVNNSPSNCRDTSKLSESNRRSPINRTFRFDHGNTGLYYSRSRELLQPILNHISEVLKSIQGYMSSQFDTISVMDSFLFENRACTQ